MIQPNELRIGNWVEWNGKFIKISELVYLITDERQGWMNEGAWLDDCKPIPLTPEILEKAGFVAVRNLHPYNAYSNGTLLLSDDYIPTITTYDDPVEFGNPCKYLHQLQNLYFALTGEELNIEF